MTLVEFYESREDWERVTLSGESWMSADAVREAREELVAELVREYVA